METQPFSLDITRLELHFSALESVQLPEYAGSTWRGALGQALRHIVCVCPGVQCNLCVLRDTCWYPRLYETPSNERCKLLKGYKDAPHPLVLQLHPLGGECPPGAELRLELVLLGRAAEAAPYLVHAAQRLARTGLGRGRGKLRVEYWDLIKADDAAEPSAPRDAAPWRPPTPWPRVWIELKTPLRLRVNNRILGPDALSFRPLFTTLLRRISLLTCFHGSGAMEADYRALADQAETVEILARELRWFRWSRYSSRQGRHVSMDGLNGRLELDLDQTPDLWPYLWAGQWLHVGKGTSMGLGRYRLSASEASHPNAGHEN